MCNISKSNTIIQDNLSNKIFFSISQENFLNDLLLGWEKDSYVQKHLGKWMNEGQFETIFMWFSVWLVCIEMEKLINFHIRNLFFCSLLWQLWRNFIFEISSGENTCENAMSMIVWGKYRRLCGNCSLELLVKFDWMRLGATHMPDSHLLSVECELRCPDSSKIN